MRTAGGERVDSVTRESEREAPTVLTYHKIGEQYELGITSVRKSRFRAHLDFMIKQGKKFICASESVLVPQGKDCVSITFDDGYESVYTDGMSMMEERRIPGTIFPVVGSIGDYNRWDVRLSPRPFKHVSWSQIREMIQRGFELGSHTLSHKDLTKLDCRMLRQELKTSKKILEDHTGVEVRAISYPFGRFSQRVVDEALEAGYKCGFVSSPRRVWERMITGRLAIYSIDGLGSLSRKLGIQPGYRFECLKNAVIARLSLGTTIVKR